MYFLCGQKKTKQITHPSTPLPPFYLLPYPHNPPLWYDTIVPPPSPLPPVEKKAREEKKPQHINNKTTTKPWGDPFTILPHRSHTPQQPISNQKKKKKKRNTKTKTVGISSCLMSYLLPRAPSSPFSRLSLSLSLSLIPSPLSTPSLPPRRQFEQRMPVTTSLGELECSPLSAIAPAACNRRVPGPRV